LRGKDWCFDRNIVGKVTGKFDKLADGGGI